MPIAEAKRHHHITRFKLVSVKLLPPPPASEVPLIKPVESMTFKETCAAIALEHTLTTHQDTDKAVLEAWDIAEQMDKQRQDHK